MLAVSLSAVGRAVTLELREGRVPAEAWGDLGGHHVSYGSVE